MYLLVCMNYLWYSSFYMMIFFIDFARVETIRDIVKTFMCLYLIMIEFRCSHRHYHVACYKNLTVCIFFPWNKEPNREKCCCIKFGWTILKPIHLKTAFHAWLTKFHCTKRLFKLNSTQIEDEGEAFKMQNFLWDCTVK